MLCQRIYYQARQSLSEGLPLHKPTVLPLDWTQHSPEHLAGFQDKYDIILLTDCIFSMDLLDDIVEILLHFSTPKTTVICCHEIRDEVTRHYNATLSASNGCARA